MKIKCKKEIIHKGFQMLSGVIANTTTKPILQNVKIEVKEDFIELFATDLEIGIRYFIPVDDSSNIEEGIVIIPETKIEGIIREWIEDYIEINVENNICNISGKDSNFLINGESDIEQFPTSPEFLDDGVLEIDPYMLSQMIKRTAFVVIGERIRYTLSGVLFSVEGNKLEMVATDGRRLSKVCKVIDNPSQLSCNCIIPAKGLLQLERVIANDLKDYGDQNLKIKVEDNRVLFKLHNFIFFIQLIEGKYPDCDKIVPEESRLAIDVNLQKFHSAVKRAAIVTTEGSKMVQFTFDDNKLLLTAEVSEVGNSEVVMDIDYDQEKFQICFNPDFIKDVLNVITNDIFTLEFTEPGRAGLLREMLTKEHSDEHFLHVVMPINLEEDYEE